MSIKPRPKRGVRIFDDTPQGINIGEGTLPFPDRRTTVIPCPDKEDSRIDLGSVSVKFACEVGKCDGSAKGDGVTCRVVVEPARGERVVAASVHLSDLGWSPIEVDLSKWRGKTVFLRLETDPGPSGNHSGDWALWSGMLLESF